MSENRAAQEKAIIMQALANNGPCMVCERKGKCRWIGGWLLCEACAKASPSITSLTETGAIFNAAIHDQVLGRMAFRHQLSRTGGAGQAVADSQAERAAALPAASQEAASNPPTVSARKSARDLLVTIAYLLQATREGGAASELHLEALRECAIDLLVELGGFEDVIAANENPARD
jgi:hypothetical protein